VRYRVTRSYPTSHRIAEIATS